MWMLLPKFAYRYLFKSSGWRCFVAFVVAINAGIYWLLLHQRKQDAVQKKPVDRDFICRLFCYKIKKQSLQLKVN